MASTGARPRATAAVWPGCTLGYAIVRKRGTGVALQITARFDRSTTMLSLAALRTRWTVIRRQAHDPSLAMVLRCSLQGDTPLGRPGEVAHAGRALIDRLHRAIVTGRASVTAAVTVALDPATIARQAETLAELSVRLTTGRDDTLFLSPWPNAAATPAWARRAEAALAGHDEAGSSILLLRPSRRGPTNSRFWALRIGGIHGVRHAKPPVVLAAQPFVAGLVGGDVVVTGRTTGPDPDTLRQTLADVDVDATFEIVETLLDHLAGSDRADDDLRGRIGTVRDMLAQIHARRLIPAFAAPDDPEATADLAETVAAAVRHGNAAIGSRWIRYRFDAGSGARLRLYGAVRDLPRFRGTTGYPVEVLHGTDVSTRLDVPVAPLPTDRLLCPQLVLGRIDCCDRADIPGPLVPVVRGGHGAVPLDAVAVPATLALHPVPAALTSQAAVGSGRIAGGTIAEILREATRWTFTFEVERDKSHSRDDLWLRPIIDRSPTTPSEIVRTTALTPLAAALLRFDAGYHSLHERTDADANEELRGLVTMLGYQLVDVLADTVTTPGPPVVVEPPPVWVWRDRPNPDGTQSLFIRTDTGDTRLPVIAGCLGQEQQAPVSADRVPGPGEWREVTYSMHGTPGNGSLSFVLGDLDLSSCRSAAVDARVVRDMGCGLDPRLARATEWRSLGPIVVPTIDIAEAFGSASSETLEERLAAVLGFLRDIAGTSSPTIELVYRRPLPTTDGGLGPEVAVPILLLIPDLEETGPVETAARIVEAYRTWADTARPSGTGRVSLSATVPADPAARQPPLLVIRQLDLITL